MTGGRVYTPDSGIKCEVRWSRNSHLCVTAKSRWE